MIFASYYGNTLLALPERGRMSRKGGTPASSIGDVEDGEFRIGKKTSPFVNWGVTNKISAPQIGAMRKCTVTDFGDARWNRDVGKASAKAESLVRDISKF